MILLNPVCGNFPVAKVLSLCPFSDFLFVSPLPKFNISSNSCSLSSLGLLSGFCSSSSPGFSAGFCSSSSPGKYYYQFVTIY